MSRIIQTESAGKERTRLIKALSLAVRQLALQREPGPEARDLAAFIVLALEAIAATIDESVVAWEKRGYWIKADKFRLEWAWAGDLAQKMRKALLADDWVGVSEVASQVGARLGNLVVSPKHRLGTPWVGAWKQLTGR
ncbi:MAG: hypothetical protein N2049_02310 [Anaerolineales bacterium]|nr:hypothetical protein [Anaerolineales bacterium]MCX7608040.1 hypothetical protein [Anaerolineales bacterium]